MEGLISNGFSLPRLCESTADIRYVTRAIPRSMTWEEKRRPAYNLDKRTLKDVTTPCRVSDEDYQLPIKIPHASPMEFRLFKAVVRTVAAPTAAFLVGLIASFVDDTTATGPTTTRLQSRAGLHVEFEPRKDAERPQNPPSAIS